MEFLFTCRLDDESNHAGISRCFTAQNRLRAAFLVTCWCAVCVLMQELWRKERVIVLS